jgi:signal transduction histidine kinase
MESTERWQVARRHLPRWLIGAAFLHRISGQLLFLILLVTLPLSGLIAWLVYSETVNAKRNVVEQVHSMAHNISEDSRAYLERNRELLSYLAARPGVRAMDSTHCDPILTELQHMSSLYSIVLLVDAQGRMVCQSLPVSGPAPSYADREWFQNGLQSTGMRVGTPIVGRLTGSLVVPLTMPVRDARGTAIGIVFFGATLVEITHLVERSVPLPPRSLVTIVSSEGGIIARSPDPNKLLGKDARQMPTLARHLEIREGEDTAPGTDGLTRIFGFTTVPEVNWLVSVGVPPDFLESRYLERLKQTIAIVIAVLGVALLFALYMTKLIRTPITSLAEAARLVAKGDLGVKALETGPIEIVDVAREFNRMLALRAEWEATMTMRTAQLETANKELDAFSYSASHDLRSPLQTIDGFSRALQEDYGEKLDPEARDYLQRIRRAVQLMGQLVDDLLRLSRLSRADMNLDSVDLGAIAAAVAEQLQAREPGRVMDLIIAPGVTAYGDERLLTVLMENLLGNAWKFTSHHARARVEFGSLQRDAERIYFVRDDGAGFDMQKVDKLFTPFQRLHSTADFPGTGIGLALVRRIVLRHGGRVWAEGAPEGGATIYFTLMDKPAQTPENK